MARRNRIWLFLLAAALLFPIWQPWLAAFLTIHLTETTSRPHEQHQRLEMRAVTVRQYSQGRLQAVMSADSVQNASLLPDAFALDNVRCQLFNDKGESALITSGQAVYAQGQHIITMVDDVHLQAKDGHYLLTSDALRYFLNYQIIKTATPVHIHTPEADIRGGSLMYNMRSGDFRVGSRVVCRL